MIVLSAPTRFSVKEPKSIGTQFQCVLQPHHSHIYVLKMGLYENVVQGAFWVEGSEGLFLISF